MRDLTLNETKRNKTKRSQSLVSALMLLCLHRWGEPTAACLLDITKQIRSGRTSNRLYSKLFWGNIWKPLKIDALARPRPDQGHEGACSGRKGPILAQRGQMPPWGTRFLQALARNAIRIRGLKTAPRGFGLQGQRGSQTLPQNGLNTWFGKVLGGL